MSDEHRVILGEAVDWVEKNPDFHHVFKQICCDWSDGNSDCLIGTFDYLTTCKSDELEKFIAYLKCLLRHRP